MNKLTCATHGGRGAAAVCGECGEPLCEECANEVRDPVFDHYDDEGSRRLVAILVLIIGFPLLLDMYLLDVLIQIRKTLIPETIVIFDPGLLHSAIILGTALIPTLYYRTGSNYSGTLFVHRRATERILCDQCASRRNQDLLYYAILGFAALFVFLGGYMVFQSFGNGAVNLTNIRIAAIGAGIYFLRDEFAYRLTMYLD